MAKADESDSVDPKVLKQYDTSWGKSFSKMGTIVSDLDKKQDEAMKKLQSSDPRQQAQGQKMMEDVQSQIDALSKQIKELGDLQKAAIQNIK